MAGKSKVSDFLDADGKWTCIKCGACCSFMSPLSEQGRFPKEWVSKDGSCTWLQEDKTCAIYDSRPAICRIDQTLRPKYSDKEIASMCKTLKDYKG